MQHPKTIKIKCGDSYAIINESDFDPSKHEKFDEAKKKPVRRRKKAD